VTGAKTRGLYAGIALDGSLLSYRSESNRAYYGQDYSARQIVIDMSAHNPGADPLRAMLMRFGPPNNPPAPATTSASPGAMPPAGQPMQNYQPPPQGGVQATPLR
jgi:SH3 domain-containing YSC84-like protein 1